MGKRKKGADVVKENVKIVKKKLTLLGSGFDFKPSSSLVEDTGVKFNLQMFQNPIHEAVIPKSIAAVKTQNPKNEANEAQQLIKPHRITR